MDAIDYDTAGARCAFLRDAGQVSVKKAAVQLDLKLLYIAQGAAVEELLKLAIPLSLAAGQTAQVYLILTGLQSPILAWLGVPNSLQYVPCFHIV